MCKLGSSLRGETKKESSREHIKKRKSKSPIHFSHLHTHSLSLILAGVRIQIPILCFCFGFGCALVASLSTKFVNEEEEKKKERKNPSSVKEKLFERKTLEKLTHTHMQTGDCGRLMVCVSFHTNTAENSHAHKRSFNPHNVRGCTFHPHKRV